MTFAKQAMRFWLIVAVLTIVILPSAAQTAAETAVQSKAAAGTQVPQSLGQPAAPATNPAPATADQQAVPPQQATPDVKQVPVPGPNEPVTTSVPLRVMVGKSLLITTTDRLRRVSVTDPAIADALVVTPTQVLVHGRGPGEVSLILWDEQERSRSFDLRVDVDVTSLVQEINHVFPNDKIEVTASRSAVVLSGHVATKEDADRAAAIAGAFTKNVVNALTYGPVGAQEVLLEVKFAEIDRLALSQYGFNIFSTGAANTVGTMTTQQFGNFGAQSVTDTCCSPAVAGTAPFKTTENISDALNLFLFRPDIHLGTVIKALQQKNVLQILAEPNLIAVNGKESSFLAGGEFPFPVVQGTAGTNAITIQFKEFGVRLKFTPLIMPNGNIHLRVMPEVSALDFTQTVTISGFTIPALSTRRADTEFEIQDGQSFVIAGLLDNRVTHVSNKFPGLGDIPILGTFFKSKSQQKSTSELMVLVTAHRIQPSAQPAPLPKFPEPFLKPEGGTPGASK